MEKSLDRIAIALEKSLQKTEGEPRIASEPLKPTDEEEQDGCRSVGIPAEVTRQIKATL